MRHPGRHKSHSLTSMPCSSCTMACTFGTPLGRAPWSGHRPRWSSEPCFTLLPGLRFIPGNYWHPCTSLRKRSFMVLTCTARVLSLGVRAHALTARAGRPSACRHPCSRCGCTAYTCTAHPLVHQQPSILLQLVLLPTCFAHRHRTLTDMEACDSHAQGLVTSLRHVAPEASLCACMDPFAGVQLQQTEGTPLPEARLISSPACSTGRPST